MISEVEQIRNRAERGYGSMWVSRDQAAADVDTLLAALAELERLMRGYQLECNECEQIAGKALGYPWYKDDQKNCPGATEADGVCVGEHVPSSVVAELARRYTEANSVSPSLKGPKPDALARVEELENALRSIRKLAESGWSINASDIERIAGAALDPKQIVEDEENAKF